MKRRSKMTVAAIDALVVFLTVWCLTDPIIAKVLLGEARVLREQIPVVVEISEHQLQNIRCFAEPGEFRNHRSKGLVLWVENPRAMLGRHLLVLDLDHEKVLVPNASGRDYRLLWNKWLIQSESGAVAVPFGDSKLDANDPDFQQSGNVISFTIPPVLNLLPGRWNVTISRRETHADIDILRKQSTAVGCGGKTADEHKFHPMLNQACQEILEIRHTGLP